MSFTPAPLSTPAPNIYEGAGVDEGLLRHPRLLQHPCLLRRAPNFKTKRQRIGTIIPSPIISLFLLLQLSELGSLRTDLKQLMGIARQLEPYIRSITTVMERIQVIFFVSEKTFILISKKKLIVLRSLEIGIIFIQFSFCSVLCISTSKLVLRTLFTG